MRRFAPLLVFLLVLFALASCAPRATIAAPDAKLLHFTVQPNGDLVVVGTTPIKYGSVTIEGSRLELESPYCDLPDCAPNENGYRRLTFPDEPDANYGVEIRIKVTSGTARRGRALFTLFGEEKTRPAPLTIP